MTWPDFMEIAHFYMIDMIWTQCMIFLFVIVFVFLSMRAILKTQIIFIIFFDVLDRFVCVANPDGKYCLDWQSGLAGWVGEQKLGFE